MVLKLIADKKLSKADDETPFDLATPISEILPTDVAELKKIYPNVFNPGNSPDRPVDDAFIADVGA